ncbi:MAG: hypothetical protein PHU77_09995 [Simplicispira sp.]|nr:hypothetical protein [Simplicispira sp.]
MKRHALPLLIALNAALLLVLAALWLHSDGSLRNVRWQAPEPITSDYLQMLPALPERSRVDTARFMLWLERPLFSLTRRPPPPPPPTPPAPVDTLADARLLGIVQSDQASAAILFVGGKNRRVRLNETVDGGWVLRAVQGRSATFVNAGQSRTLQLVRAVVNAYTGAPIPVALPPPPPPPAGPAPVAEAAAAANAAAAQAAPPASPAPPPQQTPTAQTPARRSAFSSGP